MTLKTIDNPKISRLSKEIHEVQVPPLCPKTGNPIAGSTLTISYTPGEKLLELYSLNEYVASFIGSQEIRDLELLTQWWPAIAIMFWRFRSRRSENTS